MNFSQIIKTRRFSFSYKIILIKYLFKRKINSYHIISIPINKLEKFLLWCNLHLVNNDGRLLSLGKDDFLSQYDLSTLGRVKIYLRKKPSSDIDVYHQILVVKEYEPLVNYVLSFFNKTDINTIIDAGANIGLTSIYLNKNFPNASIVSIEPEKYNFLQLNKNIEKINTNKIVTLNAGLWKCNDNLKIKTNFRDRKDWSFQVEKSNNENSIKGYSLRFIMKMFNWDIIDILKIDIEGAERFLFDNEQIYEEFLPYIKFIAIEIHDEYDIRSKIYTALEKFGFQFFESGELVIGVNLNYI